MTSPKPTVIWFIALAVLAVAFLAPAAHADGPNRTALLIVHGDGRQVSQCIDFDEAEISSFEVLNRSGLAVRFSGYSGMGAAVCAIDGEGCPREDQQCFCQCLGTPCLFWGFWLWRDGQWAFSQRGASKVPVHHGDVQAWFWADGQTPPPAISFEQICPPPPTETPLPTDTPAPTDTPRPTDTPLPTDTPAPTLVPTDGPAPAAVPTPTALPSEPPTQAPAPALADTATPVPSDTAAPGIAPSATPISTPTRVLQSASPTAAPTLTQLVAEASTAISTATPPPEPLLTATLLPSPAATAAPTPVPPGGTVLLAQYGAFALLAIALIGGFWLLRRRQGAN